MVQTEVYNFDINDTSMNVGGKQCLNIWCGSPPYMVTGWNDLLHIHAPCNDDWDPSILDCVQSYEQDWCDQQPSMQLLFPMLTEMEEHALMMKHALLK